MNKSLSWKIGLIVVVIGFSIWMLYPPKDKINLGLDLKGGMHLILQVKTDGPSPFKPISVSRN